MLDKQKILDLMLEKGPVLPKDLMKELNSNTIIIGAALSEMVSQRTIGISNMKIGGSPIYYLPEHKEKLQDFSQHLNDKDQRTFHLLRESKILRDKEQTPLVRVSLRNIKDFARPLEVSTQGRKEIFWKWYLLSNQETEQIIRKTLVPEKKKQELSIEKKKLPEVKPKIPKQPKEVKQVKKVEKVEEKAAKPKKPEPKPKLSKGKQEVEKTSAKQPVKEKPIQKTLDVKETPPGQKDEKGQPEEPKDSLHEKTKIFFKEKRILVNNISVIRKNKEIDYVVSIPSSVGHIEYYCKVKQKKRSNDGDIASAFVQGQAKKLPVLYITAGCFTKKAEAMLDKEFKHVKIARLGG